ncbi:10386_t:CDS:1, partial [Scutellospora calospora]
WEEEVYVLNENNEYQQNKNNNNGKRPQAQSESRWKNRLRRRVNDQEPRLITVEDSQDMMDEDIFAPRKPQRKREPLVVDKLPSYDIAKDL